MVDENVDRIRDIDHELSNRCDDKTQFGFKSIAWKVNLSPSQFRGHRSESPSSTISIMRIKKDSYLV